MIDLLKLLLDLLINLDEKAAGTPIEPYTNYIFFGAIIILVIVLVASANYILSPLWQGAKKIYDRRSRRKFIRNNIYDGLSFMESSDIFYAIDQFIPTRFSLNNDSADDDEPSPIYLDNTQDKGRLLIEQFCKHEFDIKTGKKYYLCLADCGMGKTTFLINLYYQISKLGKYYCKFISLQEPNCLTEIDSISQKGRTILLLDALDENAQALANYTEFAEELERKTREFYRIVITSRTNFFDSESKERLPNHQKISGIASKLSGMRKFYITPFTDDDIKRYLKLRYRWNRQKQQNAWNLIKRNKNLSVRPMLLRFMDELLAENQVFEYDFQLYECLFQKWIAREQNNYNDESKNMLYEGCLGLAKVIYYQWRKNGQIGITQEELKNYSISSLENIQMKGHAILNRTNQGVYKFSHRSYWEYMLAKLAFSDPLFTCELLIKNFDRAVSFFEEMRQYYHNHPEELTSEVSFGIATYILKYEQVENAEKYYRNIIAENNNITQNLLFTTQLTKCLQRQLKLQSAKETLQKCLTLLDKVPLSKETLPFYVQFGTVYADYCRIYHLKNGQLFLNTIINFCVDHNIIDYTLLQCYEAFCYCSINYYYQQQALADMEHLFNANFGENEPVDKFAIYLRDCTRIWCMDYQNIKSSQIIANVINSGHIYMDSFEHILWYCELGISSAVLSEWNTMAVKLFEDSHFISDTIYGNESNPYSIMIYQKILLAYNLLNSKAQQELLKINEQCVSFIIQYMNERQLQEEMSAIHFIVLGYLKENSINQFSEVEAAIKRRLEIADNSKNVYDIISAHLSFYNLYADTSSHAHAQDHLKIAYKRSQEQDSYDYRETNAYCDLLQTILCYYKGTIDKGFIARRLLETTPNVYGNDKRSSSIYKVLQEYFSNADDNNEIIACRNWMYCDFDFNKLEYFYTSCIKYNQPRSFSQELENLLIKKGLFSETEELDLERFLAIYRKELIVQTERELRDLLQRNRNLRERTNNIKIFSQT